MTSHNSGHTLRFALRWRSGAMLGLARWFMENVLTALRQIASLMLRYFVLPRRYTKGTAGHNIVNGVLA
jgi:hypothetical protein